MEGRFLNIREASKHYGGTESAWRKWIRLKLLGDGVCRMGRLVMVNSTILDERLARTGQLLTSASPKPTSTATKVSE
jgi:hypothetical protein